MTVLVALLMLAGVLAVYAPWPVIIGEEIVTGADHVQLHARRMTFARENLFGPDRHLPAWYPRELMGTPFRANLQNFPWIPTRLILLWGVEPDSALGTGAALSAALAALFTMLFCLRLGIGRVASAASGWTFACSGFYASRVLAGHLPLLEAYPALPALLWLTDRVLTSGQPRMWKIDRALIVLAVAAMCFALAGHPQLTVYGLAFASVYAVTSRGKAMFGRGVQAIVAMLLGVGMAGFALYPMAELTGRTTRVLDLDPAMNDLAVPYARLAALVFPWKDGWPASVNRTPHVEFGGYADPAYFWDTVTYIGLAPLLAVIALVILVSSGRVPARRRGVLVALMGVVALFLSLPPWQALMSNVPGTFLRSPARLMYVVGFVLALALGTAIDHMMRWSRADGTTPSISRLTPVAVAVIVLALHVADLSSHARHFVFAQPIPETRLPTAQRDSLLGWLNEGRVGFDYALQTPLNRTLDDVGFFDSIILARPYRFAIDTSGFPKSLNTQTMDAGEMAPRTLRAAGVKLLWTDIERHDLPLIGSGPGSMRNYAVPDTDARVRFFSSEQVSFQSPEQIHQLLRAPEISLADHLYLPAPGEPRTAPPRDDGPPAFALSYRRPGSDEMIVNVTTDRPGYVRVLESWDPGWSATLDGAPAPVLPGNDVFITVPTPAGNHELRLVYRTPGATTGAVISIASAVLLVMFALAVPRMKRGKSRKRDSNAS